MSDEMRVIRKVASEPGLTVETMPIPQPGDHDVLVQIEAASCCGTDLHIWRWDSWAQGSASSPEKRSGSSERPSVGRWGLPGGAGAIGPRNPFLH